VLCGVIHDHQYVGVGLFEGDNFLGDLCPLCLVAGPAECANRVRTYVGPSAGQLSNLIRREMTESKEELGAIRKNGHREDLVEPYSPVHYVPALADAELLGLADVLAQMEKWPITLEDVLQAERSALRQRFSGLTDEDLRKLVDERFEEFFEESPEIQPRH
jgi:hypothetical protein